MRFIALLSIWILLPPWLAWAQQPDSAGVTGGSSLRARAAEVLRLGTIRIRTSRGTDFMFRIGIRPFHPPTGAAGSAPLNVAPVEESAFGQISLAEVRLGAAVAKNVVFEVDNGRITRVRAAEGADALKAALAAAGGSSQRFGRFSLGFDPEATATADARGMVCLGFGGNQALGGVNPGSAVRLYCFPDATVHVDFRYLVKEGKLVTQEPADRPVGTAADPATAGTA